ncbi:hypothetical protein MMC17_008082, partial [Xylographa soralifera]|nr:hypothetical protein [Xylographa soralifera]
SGMGILSFALGIIIPDNQVGQSRSPPLMAPPPQEHRFCIIAPKSLTKTIKTTLEHRGKLDKSTKIRPIRTDSDLENYLLQPSSPLHQDSCIIPTTYTISLHSAPNAHTILDAVACVLLRSLYPEDPTTIQLALDLKSRTPPPQPHNTSLLHHCIQHLLSSLPPPLLTTLPPIPTLLALHPWTYTLYPPLLLLPHPPWPALLAGPLAPHLPALYTHICASFSITHIASNAPIPLHTGTGATPNTLRAPTALTPLHGPFGTREPPSAVAFARAFWVSTTQHGVRQTWAPLHTMFSRGNIAEKARILRLPALRAERLGCGPEACSAVDLYAGIGYFALCYAKAGVGRVLCWEINPWSVEGLRRGVGLNGEGRGKWGVRVVVGEEEEEEEDGEVREGWKDGEERVLVFQEDNQNAGARVERMRSRIPPVRHVNCGFLPSSAPSWPVAVEVLDPELGGWVHAHENIAVGDIESRKADIVARFDALANQDAANPQRIVRCENLERVKSYAPGVIHCVLDIHIAPI